MQQNWNIDFGFLMALGALQGRCPVDNARKVGECFFLLFFSALQERSDVSVSGEQKNSICQKGICRS